MVSWEGEPKEGAVRLTRLERWTLFLTVVVFILVALETAGALS